MKRRTCCLDDTHRTLTSMATAGGGGAYFGVGMVVLANARPRPCLYSAKHFHTYQHTNNRLFTPIYTNGQHNHHFGRAIR